MAILHHRGYAGLAARAAVTSIIHRKKIYSQAVVDRPHFIIICHDFTIAMKK